MTITCTPSRTRRLKVPGGWLYQVAYTETEEPGQVGEYRTYHYGWHPPVFVSDPVPVDTARLDTIIHNLEKLRINDWDATQADRTVIGALLEIAKQLRGGR